MELEFTVCGPFLGDCGLDPLSARKGLMATVSGSSGLPSPAGKAGGPAGGYVGLGGTEIRCWICWEEPGGWVPPTEGRGPGFCRPARPALGLGKLPSFLLSRESVGPRPPGAGLGCAPQLGGRGLPLPGMGGGILPLSMP